MAGTRVAVLGTGLIGGSIGLALRADGAEVIGFDEDPATSAGALARGAIAEVAESSTAAVAGAGIVVMCVPVDRIVPTCWSLGHAVATDAVVTDVGSAKAQVVAEAEAVFGSRFVGGHPMAGSERHGIDAADALLFEDAWWILTPTESTSPEAYATVAALVKRVKAQSVAIDPDVHDALVARLSHLPQLIASSLVAVATGSGDREALLGVAGGGFRDVTRIAASDPDLWVSILRSNRRAVLDALEGLGDRLQGVTEMMARDRWEELREFLAEARTDRLELFAKPWGVGAPAAPERPPIGLLVTVPDRPGVLAEITAAAGTEGVNIEDLRIIHSTEGGRGRIEMIVAGSDAAATLVEALAGLGYHIERSDLER